VTQATLTINSRNYGAWSLRGWLLCRFAGLDFVERVVDRNDPASRAELLLLSPSFLVPRLDHADVSVWDTIAIGEYLSELFPEAGLLPDEPAARAWCRSVCGEMHAGFANLRAAMPMNLRARFPGFKVWAQAKADIERIETIFSECLASSGGPFLFGDRRTMAEAMYAPVCARFVTYDVELPGDCRAYVETVMELPEMQEWIGLAQSEPDELEELQAEF
jgi:glutathione S-transferase